MMNSTTYYEEQIQKLEKELDEMTIALSQAWDQLVPFLQEVPIQANTAQDIIPILEAVSAAADSEIAGIYLFKTEEWYTVPATIRLTNEFIEQLHTIKKAQIINFKTKTGLYVHWAFAPVLAEADIIGMLGIGTYDLDRSFTALDLKIIVRMAERIGSQVAAAQLARFREREAVQLRELQIANEIQQSVQPVGAPKSKHLKIGSYWKPAKEVGGDAWGWLHADDGHLAWFILDVAGKGLPAALAAVALHTAISMALRMRLSPVETLHRVNEAFYDAYTRTDLMATAAIVTFDPNTGSLQVANAGHPPILVRHKGEWLQLDATVPPIGVLPDLDAELQTLMLVPDDVIICYSDGFSEIQTQTRLWGQDGLVGAVPDDVTDAQVLAENIVAASEQAGEASDDQTLITVIYTSE